MKSTLISFAIMVCSAFIPEDFVHTEIYDFSRPGIIAMITLFISGLIFIRLMAHNMQIRAFRRGSWRKKMVIIGAGPAGVNLQGAVMEHDVEEVVIALAPGSLLGQKIGGNELALNNQPVRGVPGRIAGYQGDSFKTRIF